MKIQAIPELGWCHKQMMEAHQSLWEAQRLYPEGHAAQTIIGDAMAALEAADDELQDTEL